MKLTINIPNFIHTYSRQGLLRCQDQICALLDLFSSSVRDQPRSIIFALQALLCGCPPDVYTMAMALDRPKNMC